MKFGKNLKQAIEKSQPEYQDKFLNYKGLKKCLKGLPPADLELESEDVEKPEEDVERAVLTAEERGFVNILNQELLKFNEFFMEKEELAVMTLQQISSELVMVDASSKDQIILKLNDLRKAFIKFHGEVVLLQHWSALNYAALVKILKKHDKNSCLVLRSSFLRKVLKQPFYNTEVLTTLLCQAEDAHCQTVKRLHEVLGEPADSEGDGASPVGELLSMPFDSNLVQKPDAEVDDECMRRVEDALSLWQSVKSKSIPIAEEDAEGSSEKANKQECEAEPVPGSPNLKRKYCTACAGDCRNAGEKEAGEDADYDERASKTIRT